MKRFILSAAAVVISAVSAYAALNVPANIKVTLAGDNRWELTWEAADQGDILYTIYGSTGVSIGSADSIGTTRTLYFKDALTTSTTAYYYKIKAEGVTSSAVSDLAACPLVKTFPAPPDAGNIILEAQNSKVLVRWAPASEAGITAYNIYRSSVGNRYEFAGQVPSAQGQYLDTDTVNGIGYSYKIAGLYNGEGGRSTPKAVTPLAAPFAPVNVSAAVSVSGSDIVLNWSLENLRGTYDISHVNFYLNVTSPVADAVINSYTGFYTDVSPAKGAWHAYKITAEDVNGNTSMPAYASVYMPDGSINTPTALTITAVTSSTVSFTWQSMNEPAQIDGFRIYRNDVTLTTTTVPSYIDSSVTTGQAYWYCVTAYKGADPEVTGCNSVTATVIPAAPVILSVSQTGTGTLELSWNNPAYEYATLYNVYRSYISGDFSSSPAITQTAKNFTDSGLPTGTARYFRINALVDGLAGEYAEISAKAVTAPVSPLEITDISGTTYNGYVNLSWTPNPDFDLRTFTVYYKLITATAYQSVTTSAVSKNITGLVNGSGYVFKVTGTNSLGSGNSANAVAVYITPSASVQLDKPMNLVVDSPGNSTLSLTWDPVYGAARYHVYRSTEPYLAPDLIAATVTSAAYVDANVYTADAHYDYKVIAIDGQSQPGSGFSDIRGNSQYTRAGPPVDVQLNNTTGGIILSWTKPAGDYTYDANPLMYRIYRSTYSGGFTSHLAETQATYYTDLTGNTLAAALFYKIKSVDSLNNEDSGSTFYSIAVSQPIQPPAVLLARPGNKRVTLTWKKVTPEYYNIYRSEDEFTFTVPIAHNIDFNGREYIDADPLLQNKTLYYYTIAAVTKGGEGPKAMTVSAVPYAPPVLTSARVTCTVKSGKNVEINWTKAEPAALGLGYDITGYNIYRSSDNGWTYNFVTFTPYLAPAGVPEYVSMFTDAGTQWDNKYAYLIRVVDFGGNTDTLYNPAFVELPLPRNRLKLHANLTDLSKGQSLTWQYVLVKGGKIKVNIHTLSGAFVKNILDTEYNLPVSSFEPFESPEMEWDGTNAAGKKVASGVYLFILELNGERSISKIAVIR